MTFEEIVQYIKEEDCRVYVYSNKDSIYGGNRGTFCYNEHGPIICLAIKQVDARRRMETLLHEYGHFLQWRDGFMQYLDAICNAYEIEERWLQKKIELSPKELEIARNTMLIMEYDAERRAIKSAEMFNPSDFSIEYYLKGAAAYMTGIKWQWARRIATVDVPKRKLFKAKLLTNQELLAPLTEKELKKMDKVLRPSPLLVAR